MEQIEILKQEEKKIIGSLKIIFVTCINFIKERKKKFITYGVIVPCIFFILLNLISLIRTSTFMFSGKTEISKKVDYYFTTWSNYKKLNGAELHELWNKRYHNAHYKWDGNSKYNEYDCTSAVYWLFQDLGANYMLSGVEDLYKRLNFLSKKRNYSGEVQEGDLIIIYVGGTNWHVGIVEGNEGGTIKYMDMDVASIGAGYRQVSFGHGTVRGIYPVSFLMWIGNLLQNVEISKDMQITIKSGKVEEIKEIETKEREPIKKVIKKEVKKIEVKKQEEKIQENIVQVKEQEIK